MSEAVTPPVDPAVPPVDPAAVTPPAPPADPATPPPATPPAEPAKPIVPEKYELKRGENSLVSDDQVANFEKYAKEKGLTNEQAQEILSRDEQILASHHERLASELEERKSQWVETVKKDKEIGGEKFKESSEFAHRFFEKFASPELKEILASTGLGNHPELVRLGARVGALMQDDKLVNAESVVTEKKSAADILYSSMDKK